MSTHTAIIRQLNALAGYRRYRTRWVKTGQLKGAHVVESLNGADQWEFIRHADELPQLLAEVRAEMAA